MTIHLGGGIKIELPDDKNPLVARNAIEAFADDVRKFPVSRVDLARIKSQLKNFSIKSYKWKDEK